MFSYDLVLTFLAVISFFCVVYSRFLNLNLILNIDFSIIFPLYQNKIMNIDREK